jgi:hypothetical protein
MVFPPTVAELERECLNLSDAERLETLPNSLQAQLGLDFQTLQPLEVVDQQFKPQGLVFAEAIALIPSNPRFIAQSGQIVLMPSSNQPLLTIELDTFITRLSLCGRSTQPITLQARDAAGQGVALHTGVMCPLLTEGQPDSQLEIRLLPRQVFKFDTATATHLTVMARAPFIIEGIGL